MSNCQRLWKIIREHCDREWGVIDIREAVYRTHVGERLARAPF